MKTPDYLVIGHITADLTPQGRILGGTTAYAARTAHAFGLKVGIVTSAGVNDPLLAELEPYADIVTLPAPATSTFENMYGRHGRTQRIQSIAKPIQIEHIPRAWLNTPLVHLAPLTGITEIDPTIARHFANATVLATIQGWLRSRGDDGQVYFQSWCDANAVAAIDIIVFSEEDIIEAPALETEFADVTKHLIVTRAANGGTYYRNGVPMSYATPRVQQKHPTGAGDIFAAALLASWRLLANDTPTAIEVAARLAATSVTRHGLNGTPTTDEVTAALATVDLWLQKQDNS